MDGASIWLGGGNSGGSAGVFTWDVGPDAGVQFWQGLTNGSGFPGIYQNMYASYITNESSACGVTGCWSNPNNTGANALFMYAGAYTPGYWDDSYSSTTAVSVMGSPVASSDGLRNAYIIEFAAPVPEPASVALFCVGIVGISLFRLKTKMRRNG